MKMTSARKAQNGSVLVICLIMLLALTFIGLSSMTNSTMQERIVGGARDQNVAFQAAEAALRVGEELAQGMIASIAAYPDLRPADAATCEIKASDWQAPAGLKQNPSAPTCVVNSYYADLSANRAGRTQSELFAPPEICIETGEVQGPTGGASVCHPESPRGLLFRVDAQGFGSTGATVKLRSTYMVVKDID
jgi:type IV pilus assembly protein PilX